MENGWLTRNVLSLLLANSRADVVDLRNDVLKLDDGGRI